MMIETNRLLLRKMQMDDFSDILEIYSHEETFKYELVSTKYDYEVKELMLNVLESYKYEYFDQLEYVVELKETRKVIGLVTFYFKDPSQFICEIGGWINFKYESQGYSLEIGQAILEYLINIKGCKKVFCSTAYENTKSWKLIERLGFEKEGHIRMAIWSKDEYFDEVLYGYMKNME